MWATGAGLVSARLQFRMERHHFRLQFKWNEIVDNDSNRAELAWEVLHTEKNKNKEETWNQSSKKFKQHSFRNLTFKESKNLSKRSTLLEFDFERNAWFNHIRLLLLFLMGHLWSGRVSYCHCVCGTGNWGAFKHSLLFFSFFIFNNFISNNRQEAKQYK